MLYSFADGVAEDIEDDLANNEEENAKGNIAQRPAVFQRADYEEDLAGNIYEEADCTQNVCNDEDTDGVFWRQAGPSFEREQRDCGADDEHCERGKSEQPDRKRRPILVHLETNEAINSETHAQCRTEAILSSSEIWVYPRARRNNASVEDEGD